MKKDITLESLYELLLGFITKQEAFNTKQETFNTKQEAFNSKQEAFNSKQEVFNSKQEVFNARQEVHNNKTDNNFAAIREDMAEFRREEKANHNLSHRMIMQAFEGISDIRSEIDNESAPWKPQKK